MLNGVDVCDLTDMRREVRKASRRRQITMLHVAITCKLGRS
jgi:hypothetical protein